MHILLQSNVSTVRIQAADDMLAVFYESLPELYYGKTSCLLNSHLLVHLAYYVRLWDRFGRTQLLGLKAEWIISLMIHSKHRIADQLVFSIDVSNTLSTIVDKLVFHESEQTLEFLNQNPGRRKNMSELTPEMFKVGIPVIMPLTRGAKGNPLSLFVNTT